MSSLGRDQVLLSVANPYALGPKASEIRVPLGTFTNVVISGNINSIPVADYLATGSSVQSLTNKSFVDNSCSFVDNTDSSIKINMNAAGATATTATIRCIQTANRVYTVPDTTDSEFVMSTGTQTISGTKNFTSSTTNYGDNCTVYNGSTVTTVGATNANLYTIPIVDGTNYMLVFDVMTGLDDTGYDTNAFIHKRVRITGPDFAMNISAPFDIITSSVGTAATADVNVVSAGAGLVAVRVSGIALNTINWTGRVELIRVSYNPGSA